MTAEYVRPGQLMAAEMHEPQRLPVHVPPGRRPAHVPFQYVPVRDVVPRMPQHGDPIHQRRKQVRPFLVYVQTPCQVDPAIPLQPLRPPGQQLSRRGTLPQRQKAEVVDAVPQHRMIPTQLRDPTGLNHMRRQHGLRARNQQPLQLHEGSRHPDVGIEIHDRSPGMPVHQHLKHQWFDGRTELGDVVPLRHRPHARIT